MIDIKSDGYIEDKTGVMYILTNVISIKLKLVHEITVEDTLGKYQVFVSEISV